MNKRKQDELDPMPRSMKAGLVVFAFIFLALIFVAGKYYLPNWKGNAVFLPVALFVGLLLIAAAASLIFRASRKR